MSADDTFDIPDNTANINQAPIGNSAARKTVCFISNNSHDAQIIRKSLQSKFEVIDKTTRGFVQEYQTNNAPEKLDYDGIVFMYPRSNGEEGGTDLANSIISRMIKLKRAYTGLPIMMFNIGKNDTASFKHGTETVAGDIINNYMADTKQPKRITQIVDKLSEQLNTDKNNRVI